MDYIHLMGSEDVARAGSSMLSAAEDMRRAASEFSNAIYELRERLNDLNTILEDHIISLKEIKTNGL